MKHIFMGVNVHYEYYSLRGYSREYEEGKKISEVRKWYIKRERVEKLNIITIIEENTDIVFPLQPTMFVKVKDREVEITKTIVNGDSSMVCFTDYIIDTYENLDEKQIVEQEVEDLNSREQTRHFDSKDNEDKYLEVEKKKSWLEKLFT